jgi:hypothetical protein
MAQKRSLIRKKKMQLSDILNVLHSNLLGKKKKDKESRTI